MTITVQKVYVIIPYKEKKYTGPRLRKGRTIVVTENWAKENVCIWTQFNFELPGRQYFLFLFFADIDISV